MNLKDNLYYNIQIKLLDYMLGIAEKPLIEDIMKKFHRILKEGTSDSRKNCLMLENIKSWQMKLEV